MSKSMFEVYLNEVTDESLRAKLKAEFERTTKKFGLVFERHSPEGIRMPQSPVRRGQTVIHEADGTFHKVLAVNGDVVTIADEHGNVANEARSKVTAARQFGEVVFPGLQSVGSLRTGHPQDPTHVIINGENFHALEMLGYTHMESVDLIYIDPPYNTGNKTWQYNDRYIAEQDSFRHSKWLSFMERRLTLAKKLLKSTGVIVVAIGDDEHHRLRMLMDEIFGANNFLSDVVWQGNIKNDARFTGAGMDYMLMYSNSKEALTEADVRWQEEKEGLHEILEAGAEIWRESGQNSEIATQQMKKWWSTRRKDFSPGLIEYKYIDDEGFVFSKSRTIDFPGGGGPLYDLFHPRTGNLIKPPSNGWRAPETTMRKWIDEGIVIFDDNDGKLPTVKRRLVDNSIGAPYPSFKADRRGAANRLTKMLGSKRFPNPKDHKVLMRWLRMMTSKDSVILDFFGGSGSTAEAVIRLNAEDQGSRQCILITNNELSAKDDAALRKAGHLPGTSEYEARGVFHNVTKPRIETVVTGMRPDGSSYSDSVPANVEFFDLAYLEESRVRAGLEYKDLAPLFWLKSGAMGRAVQLSNGSHAYGWNEESSMAVLFDAGKASELADVLVNKPNSVKHVFIITDSPEQGDLAGESFGADLIVEPIYGTYLDAFQINRSDS